MLQHSLLQRIFELTEYLKSELNTLGYPKAALFAFCVAVACYNLMSTMKASLRGVHGEQVVDEEVSDYYLFGEIKETYAGMMIAIPPKHWLESLTYDGGVALRASKLSS